MFLQIVRRIDGSLLTMATITYTHGRSYKGTKQYGIKKGLEMFAEERVKAVLKENDGKIDIDLGREPWFV